MDNSKFSIRLNSWLKSKGPKTFGDLETIFQEKSFAVLFLLLMAPAALPVPTGGITHLFELVTMLLALELVIGRRTIWLPKSIKSRNLGEILQKRALPKLVSFIGWFEKRSQKRMAFVVNNFLFSQFIGILVFILAVAAFVAVPFSGLDTLPALGIVVVSLSLILEDALLFIFGLGIGIAGAIVEISLGSAALHFLHL
jgi:hypothetical protein